MELKQVKGLGAATIQKLQNAGVHTAEQLALMDTRAQEVQGVTKERLGQLRRAAQKAIFHNAAGAVRGAARSAVQGARRQARAVERLARESTVSALAAAKRAETFAVKALEAAEKRASDLAHNAASQAAHARDAVRSTWARLSKKISELREPAEPTVDRYVSLVRRAEEAAHDAARRALDAAESVRTSGVQAATRASQGGRSLYTRLLDKMNRPNGR